ncbi:MAG: ATP synthase F1 subunit delta [Planctomycetota bacterium]
MPLIELPADALDNVYAQSVFELAEHRGGREALDSLSAEFDELVELTRQDPRFNEFLASQLIQAEAREASLKKMLGGNVSDLLRDFVLVLNAKGRLARLLSIVAAYQHMLQERFGVVEVTVYTRHPIGDEQKADIKGRLETALGRSVVVYGIPDPTMIGGVKMQIGDRLFDDSFRTMLRKMDELFRKEGAAIVRHRAGGMIGEG